MLRRYGSIQGEPNLILDESIILKHLGYSREMNV